MPLLTLDEIFLEFGDQPIFKGVNLTIEKNERISLIGRNGAGKSTLFGVISGAIQPDSGEVRHRADLRISELKQTLPRELDKTVQEYVGEGLTDLQELISTYENLSRGKPGQGSLREMETLQHQIEELGGWNIENRIAAILTELELPAEKKLSELSGGWQRRVSLARALINSPELLLLDEPTNHLDLSTIQWLENKTCAFQGSVLFVTHDRAFLQRLATRILELDRGRLNNWPYDYQRFLTEKEKALENEARHHALFDKKLEQEENWIRQGIKARRTRNEGRVRALIKMREEYASREKRQDRARISIEGADASGKKVIEARNITHGFTDDELIKNLSLKILRGDRIGLIGNNGVGKSTLLRILLGEITPKQGSVKLGTNLAVGYFDQDRIALDPEKTIAEIIGDGAEYIRINGKDRHVIGYLKGFLFSPKRAMTKIKVLSGGECNRVILAKLFSMPSNLLVLDEPTNDLDVETLEVLEEKLCEYIGTLIVVSHDREFLDNVVTSTLVFEEGGTVQTYAGGYSDWLLQGHKLKVTDDPNKTNDKINKPGKHKRNTGNKLSYKLKLELDQLPQKIESLERRVDELHKQSTAPGFFSQPYQHTKSVLDELAENERNLEQAVERWSELEQLQENLRNPSNKI